MIINRYPKKCQSCGVQVKVGEGFAYKNGYAWFTVCASTACHRALGVQAPTNITAPIPKTLTEENGFGIVRMPFDRDALPLLRAFPKASFNKDNPKDPYWKISLDTQHIKRVLEIADQLQLEVQDDIRKRGDIKTPHLAAAIKRANTEVHGKKPFDFQKTGIEFLASKKRALLADDMGVGKTVQALIAIPDKSRVLLICPAALKYNWKDEANQWRPEFNVHICEGKQGFKLPNKNEITIINYDILPEYLLEDNLDKSLLNDLSELVVIKDESHLTKNYKAKRSQKVKAITERAGIVWSLTGTPLPNRPQDLWGVLNSGNMNPFGSWTRFVKMFNGYKNQYGGYTFGMPNEEVPEILKTVMLRRLKSEVLKDLPPKIYKDVHVDVSGNLKKELDEWHKNILTYEEIDDISESDLPDFKMFSDLRAKLAKDRIPAMLEIVETYEESDTPLLVFSAHKAPIQELGKRDGWGIITGETKSEDRRNIVKDFQDGKLKGVGLTIQAGGVGLTLTRASNELFVDMDWTPAWNIQAEDRAHRIGARGDNVLIMHMVSNHPLDKHVHNLIKFKTELARKALEASIEFKPIKPRNQTVELIEETDEELLQRVKGAEMEVERHYALGRIHAIAAREAAKVEGIPEPKLTSGRKQMLRDALAYMDSVCDGAQLRDGMGFSKPDASIGKWMAKARLQDEDEVAFRVLERILVRYRRQLKEEFEAIWKPELEI